jgi:hypothetical protein
MTENDNLHITFLLKNNFDLNNVRYIGRRQLTEFSSDAL